MRRLAGRAGLLVRESKFGDVNRIAGPTGTSVKALVAKMEQVPEAAESVNAMKPPPPARTAAAAAKPGGARPQKKLDEAFFRGYVEPILTKRGKDGYACVHCHATHTLFDGTYSGAMRVVDTSNPEQSLILRKPTSSSESEGVVNAATLAHGGGVRFSKDSPEYATILEWIKGAKE
jgi:hypothetical protein